MVYPVKRFFAAIAVVFMSGSTWADPPLNSPHFFHGIPQGAPTTNDVIERSIYVLSSNATTKFSDWVAYRLDVKTITGNANTNRSWKADPDISPDRTLEPADYKDISSIQFDRGHQAPLADFKGSPDWPAANFLSNITPQKAILNRGPWEDLERAERKVVKHYKVAYIITGPLYEKEMQEHLPNADESYTVPSGYWKIIYIEPKGVRSIKAAAFIFDQETPGSGDFHTHLTTIQEIERRAHLDFASDLSDTIEKRIEKQKSADWMDRPDTMGESEP